MTPIADMVEQLLADGAAPSLIVLAIRAVEKFVAREHQSSADVRGLSVDASADDRRERDRVRQAVRRKTLKEQREKEAAQANDGVATVTPPSMDVSADTADERCDLSFFSSSAEVVTEEGSKEEKKEAVTKSARGTRMTADAQISPEDIQFALSAGITRERVPAEWAEFVDYWISTPGQRGTKLDWSATWRNRVRNISSKGGRNGQRTHARQSGESAVLAGLARAFSDRDGGTSGPADAEIPRGRFEFDAEPTRRS